MVLSYSWRDSVCDSAISHFEKNLAGYLADETLPRLDGELRVLSDEEYNKTEKGRSPTPT
jgi:hypothetical protein